MAHDTEANRQLLDRDASLTGHLLHQCRQEVTLIKEASHPESAHCKVVRGCKVEQLPDVIDPIVQVLDELVHVGVAWIAVEGPVCWRHFLLDALKGALCMAIMLTKALHSGQSVR